MDRWSRGRPFVALFAVAIAGILLVACGDDEEGGAAGTSVQVTLDEWAVSPDPASAPAGEITFDIANAGEETHEFVVIRTDLGMLDLPTADDGSVDEEGEGVEVVGEVEDIAAGASESLALDLDAGRYVLICNIFEEEMMMEMPDPSHYQSGMRSEFTVE